MFRRIKIKIKQKSWWYRIADSNIYKWLRNREAFKSYLLELDFYKSTLGTSNKLIFDVGANVGSKSKIFSLLSAKVVLFEPDLSNLRILYARLKGNTNCIISGYALSERETTAKYYSILDDSAYNSLSKKHVNTVVKSRGILKDSIGLNQIEVRTNTLDYFIAQHGLPDYIKIDVEGFEKEVVLGLNALVPLISFEANLPEFLPETLEIVDYLDQLSGTTYLFNYTINPSFELNEFITADQFKMKLLVLEVKSIEVYCHLNA